MKRYGLFLGYIALVAYAPLVFVTAKTISFKKLRDLTFLRAMAKDYLRTLPVCAIVALPALVLPPITPENMRGIGGARRIDPDDPFFRQDIPNPFNR